MMGFGLSLVGACMISDVVPDSTRPDYSAGHVRGYFPTRAINCASQAFYYNYNLGHVWGKHVSGHDAGWEGYHIVKNGVRSPDPAISLETYPFGWSFTLTAQRGNNQGDAPCTVQVDSSSYIKIDAGVREFEHCRFKKRGLYALLLVNGISYETQLPDASRTTGYTQQCVTAANPARMKSCHFHVAYARDRESGGMAFYLPFACPSSPRKGIILERTPDQFSLREYAIS